MSGFSIRRSCRSAPSRTRRHASCSWDSWPVSGSVCWARSSSTARHLLRVPYFGVRAVEDDRAQHTEPETGHESHEQEAWRRVLDGALRHDRRIENPDIRNRGLRGEPGLIVTLLQLGIRLLFQLDIAIQAHFLDGPAGNLAQIPRCGVPLPLEFRLTVRKLRRERARERGDRALLQLRDLSGQVLQRRIGLGVVIPVAASLRLLVAQITEL